MRRKELYVMLALLAVVGVIVIMLPILLAGRTVVTGENPDIEATDVMVCTSSEVAYPFLSSKLDEVSREVKVDLKFDDGELGVIGLYYEISYVNDERANEAFQMLTPELNMAMANEGVDNRFQSNARLTKSGNDVTLVLFARKGDLTVENEAFLLIENESDEVLVKKETLVENYKKIGFTCRGLD